ncbi:MAG: sulfate ABC transporter ATP-binding protein [Phycisphaerales bacterium]|nr:MAG: sulfate ABC transporter ATP-binding protein [Phycisphaerales bacterium]
MGIEVANVTKRFGGFVALNDVNLHVDPGALVALLGPSGSGKTTLLRVIAGLERPDVGSVKFEGEDATTRDVRERRVGFVFQHYALFRHMTVFENVAFGLRVRPRRVRPSRAEIQARVTELLQLVQLDGFARRYPPQMSGGQRQRVALARALAVEPKVLLLDEPFGALDAKVRQELRRWLRRLHEEIHVTTVFVTHDQDEALELADRVVVMNAGCIEQIGTPDKVFRDPASAFVMNFLGTVNVFHRRVSGLTPGMDAIEIQCPDELPAGSRPARIFVRPHNLEIDTRASGRPRLRGRVQFINAAGPQVKIEVLTEFGEILQVETSQKRYRALGMVKGGEVYVTPKEMRVFFDDSRPDQADSLESGSDVDTTLGRIGRPCASKKSP